LLTFVVLRAVVIGIVVRDAARVEALGAAAPTSRPSLRLRSSVA
jgi:hypothetical protein